MSSFNDRHGRQWILEFTLGSLARVKTETGVDLLTFHQPDSPALRAMATDPWKLLEVLVSLLRPQLEQKGVSEEAFGDSLLEEHVQAAVEALLTGMVDYYPPAKRTALKTLVDRVLGAVRNVSERANRELTTVMATTDLDAMQKEIETAISGNSTGSSPASSESTPAP